ncbi:hypothetical protein ACO0OL_003411 [Hanseniaspora opuntiae]|jgi:mitochondrial import receptor subunit TOM7
MNISNNKIEYLQSTCINHFLNMAIKLPAFILSDETREKINQLFEFGQKIAHYGWVPFVLYLGWQSNPNRPGLLQLLTPLPSA